MRTLVPQLNVSGDVPSKAGVALANPVAREVLVAIRRISRAIDLRSRALMQEVGLTGPQLMVLALLREQDLLSIASIARHMHLSQPTAAGIVSRLEARGMVDRKRSETDRRCMVVSLTDAGQAIQQSAPALLQEQLLVGLAQMKQWEQTQLLSSLQRLVEMMQAGKIDAAPMLEHGPITNAGLKPVSSDPDMYDAGPGSLPPTNHERIGDRQADSRPPL